MIKGVKSSEIKKVLNKIPLEKRLAVETITRDLANNMKKVATDSFPNAQQIDDRFHVVQLVNEALQELRLKYKREALKEENKAIKKNKKLNIKRKKKKKYESEKCDNEDTRIQLLTRSRYLLFKSKSNWTESQKVRAEILFKEYPKLESLYNLVMMFRNIYEKSKTRKEAKEEYKKWYKKVEEKGIEMFNTAMETIKNNEAEILNFFDERRTNSLAETFNSKLKSFRAIFRGVRDLGFFFYRLQKLFA